MDLLGDLFTDYTLRNVAAGAAVLGIVSGTLGSFALLRQQSLMGDAVSHAALPGVVIAYMLTASKAPWFSSPEQHLPAGRLPLSSC